MPIWLGAALLSIASASAGQILLKLGVKAVRLPADPTRDPLAVLLAFAHPFVIGGVVAFAASMVFWLAAINGRELSSVYPLAALGYVVVFVVSVVLFREDVSFVKVAGLGLIVAGVVVMQSAAKPDARPTSAMPAVERASVAASPARI